jgi:hypothetical protein
MLSARAFLVWKERHLTKFGLGAWRRDGTRDVLIDAPPVFSVRTQRNADLPATSWHVPVAPPPPPKCGKYGPSDRGRDRRGAPTVVVKRPELDAVAWLCCVAPAAK